MRKKIDGQKLYNLCQDGDKLRSLVNNDTHWKKIERKGKHLLDQEMNKAQSRSILPCYSLHSEGLKSRYLYNASEENSIELTKEWEHMLWLNTDLHELISLTKNQTIQYRTKNQ